jgi:hypothetical protein
MKDMITKEDVRNGNYCGSQVLDLIDRVVVIEALCKECADHLDEDFWRSIPNDSYLHRDLKKKGDGL